MKKINPSLYFIMPGIMPEPIPGCCEFGKSIKKTTSIKELLVDSLSDLPLKLRYQLMYLNLLPKLIVSTYFKK